MQVLTEVLEAGAPYVGDSVIRGTGSWQHQGNSTLCWTQDTTSPSHLEQAKPGASLPRPQGSSRPEEVYLSSVGTVAQRRSLPRVWGVPGSRWSPRQVSRARRASKPHPPEGPT